MGLKRKYKLRKAQCEAVVQMAKQLKLKPQVVVRMAIESYLNSNQAAISQQALGMGAKTVENKEITPP